MTTKKIVLITGANKGIGLATATALAQDGHTVLLGARDPERGKNAAAGLTAQGLGACFIHLDVTKPATITTAAKLIEADYGRLDILVNNAAITRDQSRPPGEMPATAVREVYDTNVFGVIAVTNAMLPLLCATDLNGHTGTLSADEGGAHIARQTTAPETGVFLNETGGTYPW